MKNFRHSIVALTALAMICSAATVQTAGLRREKSASAANIGAQSSSSGIKVAAATPAPEEEVKADSEAAAKKDPATAYTALTGGTLNVRSAPSEESDVVGELGASKTVKVLSSTDGWCNVSFDDGNTGYVKSDKLTQNKEKADYLAMNYENYKKATVDADGYVRVRSEASTNSDIVTELEQGTPVVALWTEGDFIRVAYGDNYNEGYIVDTGLSLTGEWVPKTTVSNKQEEIAEAEAAESRANAAAEARSSATSAPTASPSSSKSSSSSSSSSSAEKSSSSSSSGSSTGQAIVNTARQYLGVPYVWGGTSPKGFDCSGLVQYVCSKNGISVSRTAADQAGCGTHVSKANLQPGDLVFFGPSGIHHVGIYIGNGNMIHAPHTGDVVKVTSIDSAYYSSQYAGAVRVY